MELFPIERPPTGKFSIQPYTAHPIRFEPAKVDVSGVIPGSRWLVLQAAKDTNAGSATLGCDADSAIAGLEGITVAGAPRRVTKILLSNESLTGTIPVELGDLSQLTHPDLSLTSLTGEIPKVLEELSNLQKIRLSATVN